MSYLVKHGFWYTRSGLGLRLFISNKRLGDAADPRKTFWVARVRWPLQRHFKSLRFWKGHCLIYMFVDVFSCSWERGTELNLTAVTAQRSTPLNLIRMNSELRNWQATELRFQNSGSFMLNSLYHLTAFALMMHAPLEWSPEMAFFRWSQFLDDKWQSLSHVQLFASPWTVACQTLLSMEFSRQEYWSGLPFTSPGDLPDSGIEPGTPAL